MEQRSVWVELRAIDRQTVVYWAAPVPLPVGIVGFNVYRSPQPTSDLTSKSLVKLTPNPIGFSFLLDPQSQIEPFGISSYVVTVVETAREWVLDRPVQVGDTSDSDRYGRRFAVISMPRVFEEFRRRKDILLGLNSERVTFLIRRLIGKRCAECFSGAMEGSTRADCQNCYGTGWERGYEPVVARCRIGSISEALNLDPAGLKFGSNPNGWHVGFPLLRQGDVVARIDGKRYEAQKISMAVHQGILTGQDYELVAYDPFHPIYNFPLDLP